MITGIRAGVLPRVGRPLLALSSVALTGTLLTGAALPAQASPTRARTTAATAQALAPVLTQALRQRTVRPVQRPRVVRRAVRPAARPLLSPAMARNLARLRSCEASGNYRSNTGNGFYGAYQFDRRTWRSVGEVGLPHQASTRRQDLAAARLQARRGWQPWPVCSRRLGLR